MLYNTRGIVLNFIKYRETSIITKIYTEKFGLQTYIINGIRSAKSKQKIALYQPLTQLDLIVYKKNNAEINRLSEAKCFAYYTNIPFDIKKATLSMFLTEVLNKSLKEESEDPFLFEFISNSFIILDKLEHDYESFHIQFMCKLSRYLGFSIESAEEVFEQVHENANHTGIAKSEKKLLDDLIKKDYDEAPACNGVLRRELVILLIKFYRLHLTSFTDIRSLAVLSEVLH